jgi:hypothetical protein
MNPGPYIDLFLWRGQLFEGLACGGLVQADLKQAYVMGNWGLRLGCVKGQTRITAASQRNKS